MKTKESISIIGYEIAIIFSLLSSILLKFASYLALATHQPLFLFTLPLSIFYDFISFKYQLTIEISKYYSYTKTLEQTTKKEVI